MCTCLSNFQIWSILGFQKQLDYENEFQQQNDTLWTTGQYHELIFSIFKRTTSNLTSHY